LAITGSEDVVAVQIERQADDIPDSSFVIDNEDYRTTSALGPSHNCFWGLAGNRPPQYV